VLVANFIKNIKKPSPVGEGGNLRLVEEVLIRIFHYIKNALWGRF